LTDSPIEKQTPDLAPSALARRAAELALTKQAQDVVLLDLSKISSICDYFVVCHGESDTQVKAIVDAIDVGLKEEGARSWHIEGREARNWVLIDYVDVVVHVFQSEVREYYRLEDLWADAPREELKS